MKKKYSIVSGLFVIAAGVLLYGGCSNFLNRQPQGVETSDIFFTTEDQANRALNAAYGAIAWQYSADGGNWFNQWMIGDIVSDDAEKGGEGPADIGDLEQLREFKAPAQNAITAPQYQVPYIGIHRANLVIKNVSDTSLLARSAITDSSRAKIVAEAKFLRAWSYFILVKSFGDVPIDTVPYTSDQLIAQDECHAKAPKAQVWALIEKDLTEAAAILPEATDVTDAGRATKGAANALLVKAYIYQKNFSQAETLANTIITSGQYILDPSFEDVFATDNGPESVFEIQYVEDPADSWTNTNQGQLISVFQGMRDSTYFTGWGFDCPTPNLDSAFEPGDKRRNATIIHEGDTLYPNTPAQQIIPIGYLSSSPTHMNAKKYLLDYEGDVPDMDNAPKNWRAIRYADVLLFHAEAANENGNLGAARISLNKVRARAGLAPVTTTDMVSLRTIIYHERRVELALEGQRFWDVVRQDQVVPGRAAAVLGPLGFVSPGNNVFPIPQIEIDVCSKLVP